MQKALDAGVDGVFLINHGVPHKALLGWTEEVAKKYPDVWVGLNMLPLTALEAFNEIPETLFSYVKAIWVDDANINEASPHSQPYPSRVLDKICLRKFPGLYFGGISFKYQRAINSMDSAKAAKIARNYMHVVTTSGSGTGKPPDVDKIAMMRLAAGESPLAIASGIAENNIRDFLPHRVACYMVATGVSDNFHDLSVDRMKELVEIIHTWQNPK